MFIYSYDRVMSVDKRMFKLDPTRAAGEGLNTWVPANGISIRGIVYATFALSLSVLLGVLPLLGDGFTVLPWWVRIIVIPGVVTGSLMRAEPDGRSSHLLILSVVGFAIRRVKARQSTPVFGGKYRVRWDVSDTALHRAHVQGPAEVRFRAPVELQDRWDGWRAEGGTGEPQRVPVRADQKLRVRP